MSDSIMTDSLVARQGPLIIKLSGGVIDAPSQLKELCNAIVQLHETLPQGIVIVHGGGGAVDQHLERLGLATQRSDGIRNTPPQHIQEIVGVLAGRVNKKLVGQLQRCGANAVGLCLGDGLLAKTTKVKYLDEDPGCVGDVTGGNPLLIETLLNAGFLPVLASIGLDENGQPLNVNADSAAAGIAKVINASGLVFLTDTQGVLDTQGNTIANLCPSVIESKIQTGEIKGGMAAKVRSAAIAVATTNIPVTIASFNDPASLGLLGKDKLVGTRILPLPDSLTEPSLTSQNTSPTAASANSQDISK